VVHRSIALLALALALALHASAPAAPRQVARFVPSYAEPFSGLDSNSWATPVLAGESAVWARSRPGGGWSVERGTPGARPTRVAFSERPVGGYRVLHRIRMAGGSPTRIAWSDSATEVFSASHMSYQPIRSRVLAAAPGVAPVPIVGCASRDECYGNPEFVGDHTYVADLHGDVVAYVTGAYPDYTVVVDDVDSPADPVRIETGVLYSHLRLAGDYVAYVDASKDEWQTVVYDWRARREVYRVPHGEHDLQADGKLARIDEEGRLVWHSPSEPRAHRIDSSDDRRYDAVRIGGDRILATHGLDGLRVVELDGRFRDIGVKLRYTGYDFDGGRATWATAECGFVSVWLDPDVDVEDPQKGEPELPPCTPPEIRGIQATGDGRVVVKLVCADSCRGPALGTASPLARRRIGLRASRRALRVHLRPSKADRERLRKRPSPLNVQAIFEGRDRDRPVAATKRGSLKRP
jgi:hypothetical protein